MLQVTQLGKLDCTFAASLRTPPDWGWWACGHPGCTLDECTTKFYKYGGRDGVSCLDRPWTDTDYQFFNPCSCEAMRAVLEEILDADRASPGTTAQRLARLKILTDLVTRLDERDVPQNTHVGGMLGPGAKAWPCLSVDDIGGGANPARVYNAIVSIRTSALTSLAYFANVGPNYCANSYAHVLETSLNVELVHHALIGAQLLVQRVPVNYIDTALLDKLLIKSDEIGNSPKTYGNAVAAQASATSAAIRRARTKPDPIQPTPPLPPSPFPLTATSRAPKIVATIAVASAVGVLAGLTIPYLLRSR